MEYLLFYVRDLIRGKLINDRDLADLWSKELL